MDLCNDTDWRLSGFFVGRYFGHKGQYTSKYQRCRRAIKPSAGPTRGLQAGATATIKPTRCANGQRFAAGPMPTLPAPVGGVFGRLQGIIFRRSRLAGIAAYHLPHADQRQQDTEHLNRVEPLAKQHKAQQ